MSNNPICYLEVCNLYYLREEFFLLKNCKSFFKNSVLEKSSINEFLTFFFRKLKAKKYHPKRSKKISVLKTRKKTLLLNLVLVIDKVIQRRILKLLVLIVEFLSYEQSFGFRSKRGSHDALKYLKFYGLNLTWIIKVEINKYFYRLGHKILLTKLYDYMDQSSAELASKFCEVGVVKLSYLAESFQVFKSVSQRCLISPLFCNIYLHSFDKFVLKNLMRLYTKKNIQTIFLKCKKKMHFGLRNFKLLSVCFKFKC